MIGPTTERRLWLVMTPAADGGVEMKVTRMEPGNSQAAVVMLRSRGQMVGEDVTFHVPRAANDGKDATPDQIATAVQTYLTAHPPAPGRAPTSAEIASAVAAYFVANPTPTKVEFTISLVDAYAVGLLTGGAEKRIACAGLKTSDALSVQATAALPAGYAGLCISCTENGWARLGFVRPALGIGVSNPIPLRITALR